MTSWKTLALATLVATGSTCAVAQSGAVHSLDIRVPLAPQPVRVGDDVQLFYELQLINFDSTPLTLLDLAVLDENSNDILAGFQGEALSRLADQSGSIAPGMHRALYLTVPMQRSEPRALSHRLRLGSPSNEGSRSITLTTEATSIDTSPVPEFGPPLRGGTWAALYDPDMERGHRRVWYAVDGHAHLPGRFAIDFFGVDANGKTHRGSGEQTMDYFGYGADVLAVADGTVIATREDFVESKTLAAVPDVSIGDETGVYIALDIGAGRFAFYEHLQPGLAVKVGQKVRRGERLGALGLTGSAVTPHLHLHLANANAALAAEGLPFHFASYRLLGGYAAITDFGERPWRPLPQPRTLTRSRPAPNVVLSFD